MRIKLDKKWRDFLLDLPESGMGYQTIEIVLKCGRKVKNVNVYNSEILDLPDEQADFKPEEIRGIKLVQP